MSFADYFRRALEPWKVESNGVVVFRGVRDACWNFLHQAGPGDHTMTPDPPNHFREGYDAYSLGKNQPANPYTGLEAEVWRAGWLASQRSSQAATS